MDQIKVELQESMGNDRSIAEAAWTSSTDLQGKEKRTDDDVKRIVNMLSDHKHSTPFESVVLRFWIKMPIQTDRQHMTHRVASHNGMSGRYRTMPDEFYRIPFEVSEIIEKSFDLLPDSYNVINTYYRKCEEMNTWYRDILKCFKQSEQVNKITNSEYKRIREFFRGVLPQNNMTERVTVMNLRSFANYQKLRNSEHAQPEIQQVAKLMLEAVEKANICPIALESLKRNNWQI